MKYAFLTLALASLCTIASAQSKEEQDLSQAVDAFAKAMLDGDSSTLRKLTDQSLVYGHSSGKMESQDEFVGSIGSGTADFKALNLSGQSINIKGKTGVVRHQLKGNVVDHGKEAPVNLGILMVWHRSKEGWKLLGRQGFKLP
jgi:ketosteroid isomerase-like protein